MVNINILVQAIINSLGIETTAIIIIGFVLIAVLWFLIVVIAIGFALILNQGTLIMNDLEEMIENAN